MHKLKELENKGNEAKHNQVLGEQERDREDYVRRLPRISPICYKVGRYLGYPLLRTGPTFI